MRLLACCLFLLCATQAQSGARLREEGTAFLATSVLVSEDGESDGALFFEYGLRPKLTLGLKVDAAMTQGRVGGGSGFAFLRRPLPVGERDYKLAYELGLGATVGAETDPLLRTALSYGRGLTWRDHYGWLSVDFSVEWSLGGDTDTAKLDTTLGMGLGDQVKVMMQVFLSQTETQGSVTLAPSLIWQPKPDRPSYQIGFEAEDSTLSLRLGLWTEF